MTAYPTTSPKIRTGDVVGCGYEGRDASDLVQWLLSHGVHTVADVRLNPVSRKRGLSKRALADALAAAGITYVHLPALGNPQDNRAGFASPVAADRRRAHARYQRVLDSDDAVLALATIEQSQDQGRVALLCFEADESACHRHLILRALDDRQRQ